MRISPALKAFSLRVCLIGLPVLGFYLGWDFHHAANGAIELRSGGRFAQLQAALEMYHEEHGAFPPTKYQPVAGGPIHSWRVLLLPYTSQDLIERYPDYDFSREWNSPGNLQALGQLAPSHLRRDGDGETTHYLAIGDGDDWPSWRPLRSCLISEGEDRFLLFEDPDSEVHWMEPKW